ncbi:MAG: hypothetical protein LBR16_00040 [Treponema sp.]|jgi:hypothetical protein|nr:hypothetical protein [Treponema sp.]
MQDQDYEYFLQNTADFYRQYGPKFLAIKNKGVLGVYGDFNEALDKTLKQEEWGTFLIQECLKDRKDAVHYFQGNVLPYRAQERAIV